MAEWDIIIGLEVHAQLNTKTKLFSSAPNHFGDEPNTNISIVDTGQPGSLPVLNKQAVFKAVQLGLALGSEVCKFSKFDRKSYFYPDSPRNFQITQLDYPIIKGGKITTEIDGEMKTFEIDRAHLEDDAGMLKHFASFAGVDYNRAGVPLIEIVSTPCMSSPKEAVAYIKALKTILEYTNVSDCNMEEGSLRIDVNISVKKSGEKKLRNKVEIKNMNSFHFVELALISEIERQIQLYEKYPNEDPDNVILPGTYRYDTALNKTVMMRMKERAEDYRYFPEPDLTPIMLTDDYIDSIRKTLPELPQERLKRYVTELKLSTYAAATLVIEKATSDYFEHCLTICDNAKALCNWITIEFPGRLKEMGHTLYSIGIPAKHVATLINLIDQKKITGRIAKQVADDMIKNPGLNPTEIVKNNPNYRPLSDSLEIEPIVKKVLSDNPQSIEDYKLGKKKAFAFLVGQVMKQTKGKASPEIVNELIHKNIDFNH